jgi:hypothetical protein
MRRITPRPSFHLHIKMKTPLQPDNASHHHPQCPYPHTFSLQQAYNPAFITRDFSSSNSSTLEATAIRAGCQALIFPGTDFWSLLMLFASDCTKGTKETNTRRCFLERKERGGNEALGFRPISLLSLSYISSLLDHAQTNLYAGPEMNLGPLDRTFFTILHSVITFLTRHLRMTPSFDFEICKNIRNKIGMCFKKAASVRQQVKTRQQPKRRLASLKLTYLGTYVYIPKCRYLARYIHYYVQYTQVARRSYHYQLLEPYFHFYYYYYYELCPTKSPSHNFVIQRRPKRNWKAWGLIEYLGSSIRYCM